MAHTHIDSIQSVLFDLDGTLLDTAPDIIYAINKLRELYQLPPLPLPIVRPCIGQGSKKLLQQAFNIDEQDTKYPQLLQQFHQLYQQHLTTSPQLFSNMEKVLTYLEQKRIHWGIVTNKPARFTNHLLDALALTSRAHCIISGDTLSKQKPEPDQILYACRLLQHDSKQVLYVGDTEMDVVASKAAGSPILVALYGYTGIGENPFDWHADGYIADPVELIAWLDRYTINNAA